MLPMHIKSRSITISGRRDRGYTVSTFVERQTKSEAPSPVSDVSDEEDKKKKYQFRDDTSTPIGMIHILRQPIKNQHTHNQSKYTHNQSKYTHSQSKIKIHAQPIKHTHNQSKYTHNQSKYAHNQSKYTHNQSKIKIHAQPIKHTHNQSKYTHNPSKYTQPIKLNTHTTNQKSKYTYNQSKYTHNQSNLTHNQSTVDIAKAQDYARKRAISNVHKRRARSPTIQKLAERYEAFPDTPDVSAEKMGVGGVGVSRVKSAANGQNDKRKTAKATGRGFWKKKKQPEKKPQRGMWCILQFILEIVN